MSTLREIAIKFIKGELPLTEAELAAERVKLCETCDEFARVSRQCKVCWCFIDLKTKVAEAECPQAKW